MTRDDIQMLYEYDGWANNRILNAVSTLSAEKFTHDLDRIEHGLYASFARFTGRDHR